MSERIVKIKFKGPVHFGRGRLSQSAYTCDAATLFSALYLEAMRIGCADELLSAAKAGRLSISDAFPYIGDRLYCPKPIIGSDALILGNADVGSKDPRIRKAAKKLDYIPLEGLEAYMNGSFDFMSELERFDLGKAFLRNEVNLFRSRTEDAEPFYVGGFRFRENAGIYFIVRGSFNIEPIMELLQFSGLGGKRTSGFGRFAYEVCETEFISLSSSEAGSGTFMLLSSSAPTATELMEPLLEGASYKLVRKSGFVQSFTHNLSPQKKADMYVFATGSTFKSKFSGEIYDVNTMPDAHPVYRYARSLWMEV